MNKDERKLIMVKGLGVGHFGTGEEIIIEIMEEGGEGRGKGRVGTRKSWRVMIEK